MSHTNQTQYYNLPQFIGTDVPGWLTDVNQGYSAIDAGMRAAQVKADNADQTAGQAANDVAALSNTVSSQSSQISAAAYAASSAQNTANAADAKAQQALDAIGSSTPVIIPVNTTNWSLDSATARYKKTIPMLRVSSENPMIAICGQTAAAVPTDAELAAYSTLVSVKADTTQNELVLYAKSVPDAAFYMQVTGVTM